MVAARRPAILWSGLGDTTGRSAIESEHRRRVVPLIPINLTSRQYTAISRAYIYGSVNSMYTHFMILHGVMHM